MGAAALHHSSDGRSGGSGPYERPEKFDKTPRGEIDWGRLRPGDASEGHHGQGGMSQLSPLSRQRRDEPRGMGGGDPRAIRGIGQQPGAPVDPRFAGGASDHHLVTSLQALGYPLLAARRAAREAAAGDDREARHAAAKAWLEAQVAAGNLPPPVGGRRPSRP